MRRDMRDFVEVAFEAHSPFQHVGAEGIGRFQHQQRLFLFGKYLLEIQGCLRDGIAGHDQAFIAESVGMRVVP